MTDRLSLLLAATLACAASPFGAPARAQSGEPVRIGVAAPLSGPNEILGRQIVAGARAASGTVGGDLVEADTACTAQGGAAAARRFVEARVDAAIGFLCTAALESALPILSRAAIPAIDVGVRADRILKRRERDRTLVWRLAPGSTAEAEAIARFVRERWSAMPFGIVEDGSAYGRDLADAVRESLDAQGLRASLVDNFRPAEEKQFALARRIAQSGVTHVLVFGARSDVAIIARDAAASDLALTIAGGEALVDEGAGDVPLASGVFAIASGFDVDWSPAETAPADEGYARPARLAADVAAEAVRRARASGRPLPEVLDADTFKTPEGPVRFDAGGSADVVPFRTYRWDGSRFVADSGT